MKTLCFSQLILAWVMDAPYPNLTPNSRPVTWKKSQNAKLLEFQLACVCAPSCFICRFRRGPKTSRLIQKLVFNWWQQQTLWEKDVLAPEGRSWGAEERRLNLAGWGCGREQSAGAARTRGGGSSNVGTDFYRSRNFSRWGKEEGGDWRMRGREKWMDFFSCTNQEREC